MRAIIDRYAHRLAPLSMGQIERDVVRCGYHGLAFDGNSGRCIHNPHGPISSSLAVRIFPLVERHKIIWIWMGEVDAADDGEIPDMSFIDEAPQHALSVGYMPTAADHRLLEDNILDLSHGDYLHEATLGGGSFTRANVTVEERGDNVLVRWSAKKEKAIPIWQPELPDPEMLVDTVTEVLWYPTGVMLLDSVLTPSDDSRSATIVNRNAQIMTPETATVTHYFYCNTRNYRTDDADYNAAITTGLASAFGGEDKPMIEAQQQRIGTSDLLDCRPALMSIDNASTRARRIYKRLLAAQSDGEGEVPLRVSGGLG